MSEEQQKIMMYFPADTRRDGKLVTEVEVEGEGPRIITPETVRYWCRHTRELKGSQVKKAERFANLDCVHYTGNGRFIVLPLNTESEHRVGDRIFKKKPHTADYNSSEYLIQKLDDGTFRCNCQGWATREKRGELVPEGANCSHVLALYYAFKLKRFKNSQLRVEWAR